MPKYEVEVIVFVTADTEVDAQQMVDARLDVLVKNEGMFPYELLADCVREVDEVGILTPTPLWLDENPGIVALEQTIDRLIAAPNGREKNVNAMDAWYKLGRYKERAMQPADRLRVDALYGRILVAVFNLSPDIIGIENGIS